MTSLKDRREFLALLGIGAATLVAGCSAGEPGTAPEKSFPAAVPGRAHSVSKVPGHTRDIVLTIDDGADAGTVSAYVDLARETGLHLTFNPNGMRAANWAPHAGALAPMIEAGQVQIANHTFHHRSLVGLAPGAARAELERNEDWIQRVFGTSSRPYYRPPNGRVDHASNLLCGELGYTTILLWDGSFQDSTAVSEQALLAAATRALQPSSVVVGHANAPTVTHLYPRILELIKARDLNPVTLDQAFGTSRRTG